MKPQRTFVAERALANHCPELLSARRTEPDGRVLLESIGQRFARALPSGLARLAGYDAPVVRCKPARACTMGELSAQLPPLAACSVMGAGTHDLPLVVVFQAEAVFSLIDRAFGGGGSAPDPLPEAFPLAAELFIGRLEGRAAAAFADKDIPPVRCVARDGNLARIAPCAPDHTLVAIDVEVSEPDGRGWTITLAMPPETLAVLHGPLPAGSPANPKSSRDSRSAPAPGDEPFGSVPLDLSAVLVDMRIGISRLSDLKPGDILPVSVARSVPLRIGDRTIAHGTIGEVDDRVAVQITQAF